MYGRRTEVAQAPNLCPPKAFGAGRRSSSLPAVCIRAGSSFFVDPADWKSAIRQAGSLRYHAEAATRNFAQTARILRFVLQIGRVAREPAHPIILETVWHINRAIAGAIVPLFPIYYALKSTQLFVSCLQSITVLLPKHWHVESLWRSGMSQQ